MLATAGFVDIGAEDRTAEYRATQAAWIEAVGRRSDAIREIMGDQDYEERVDSRTRALAAIDAGLLSRFMYRATRP